MSDKQFSLFELHFHDSVQFGPRTLDGLRGDAEADTDEPATTTRTDDTAEKGASLVRRLVGLAVLAAAAYAVRKLLDGEPGGLDALDDIEAGTDEEAAADEGDAVSIEVTSGEESSDRTGFVVAALVGLLVVLALAVRKLLGDAVEDIEASNDRAA
ncbi:MAG: hypothetical protein ABEH90_02930 [Halolamina sp.]